MTNELLSEKKLQNQTESELLRLPEKVLQFGTGVLLRGLPCYLIDRANRRGIFQGRVVVVKSTDQGDLGAFERQNYLYTVCTRGIHEGQIVHKNEICTAISRVLAAKSQWQEILACAANPQLGIVISNTTEAGIVLQHESLDKGIPASFPGKLLAFLYERFRVFNGDFAKGMVIVPTELIPDNGKRLEAIVLELAHYNQLDYAFIEWLEQACIFCNSLVDRIVPGAPTADKAEDFYEELGYRDELLTITEPYCFWAIEGNVRVAPVLSFQQADPDAVVITPDIRRFQERKLRLLNGTHTLCCGPAFLAGFETVSEAMNDVQMLEFAELLMSQEIAPAIPGGLPAGEAETFGAQVLDRFRNPFVEHRWRSIAVQYAFKMRSRVVPLLWEYHRRYAMPPQGMAFGFAAFLLFYRADSAAVSDDAGARFREYWTRYSPAEMVDHTLSDSDFWGGNLTELPGFAASVTRWVDHINREGLMNALHSCLNKIHENQNTANTLIG